MMYQIKKRILKILAESEERVCDEDVAAKCGVSVEQVRSVCEAVAAARSVQIENGGERNGGAGKRKATSLMPTVIEECAEGVLFREVVLFPETESTNDVAWMHAGRPDSTGLVVLAESQRKGRGRFSDRVWQDVPGCSILMSMLLDGEQVDGDMLSVVLGLAAAKSLEKVCGLSVGIKWPNDIVVSGKKLCGIMVESRFVDGRQWYVPGIGINCNQGVDDFCDELKVSASSVYIETGKLVDRNVLAVWVLCEIDELLSGRVALDEVVRQWRERNCDVGRFVCLECDGERFSGEVVDVEPLVGITLKLGDGSERVFDSRTTTIVPQDGKLC